VARLTPSAGPDPPASPRCAASAGSAARSAAERARSAHVALPVGRGRGGGGRLGASRIGGGGGAMKLNAAKLGAKKTDDLFEF